VQFAWIQEHAQDKEIYSLNNREAGRVQGFVCNDRISGVWEMCTFKTIPGTVGVSGRCNTIEPSVSW
jgi:hypothetical protein